MGTHMIIYDAQKPQIKKKSRKTNKKGLKKIWVPKDKITYIADILSSIVKTLAIVPEL